ncbi:biotin carboxylase [Bosea sp. OAE506]|uniref:ATP-grasp domain-containing protein n=1 Tax=Bosea sp. OAE506 TaxID=2663870 RepID=UPI0017899094
MRSDTRLRNTTIVVLAASVQQIPLILRLQSMGARVVTIDNRPDNPGHRLAAATHDIDLRDIDRVLAAVRQEGAHGIIAAASDVAVETAAHVGHALGLSAPSPSAVAALLSKAAFRAFQHSAGLPAPQWALKDDEPPVGPWIVKPVLGSGSRGVRLIDDAALLPDALANAAAASLDGRAIVEQAISGSQHTAEGWMQAGRVAAGLVTDRLTADAPLVATLGHRTPGSLSAAQEAEVLAAVERVFQLLGYADGPFDADIVVNDQGPFVIEASTRAGGNGLMQLVKASTGVDTMELIALHAVGLLPQLSAWRAMPAGVQILASPLGGTLDYDPHAVERLRNEQWVEDLTLDEAPGASVQPFTDGRCRFGQVVISCRDGASVANRLAEVFNRLDLQVMRKRCRGGTFAARGDGRG